MQVLRLPLEAAPRREVVEVPSIVDLDDEDRLAFEKLLLDYPTLRSLLSSQNEEVFLSAYHEIPRRPSWVPVFRTAADIKRRESAQDDVRDHYRRALQAEFVEGRVATANRHNAPINKQSKQPKRKVASAAMPSPDNSIQSVGALAQSATDLIAGVPDTPKQPVSEIFEQPLGARPQPRGKVTRLKRVCELTGLGRSSIYNRMD